MVEFNGKTFNNFIYVGYDILINENKIVLHYSVDNLYFFNPEYSLDLNSLNSIDKIEYEVFNFGMSEISSFYKAFCADNIIIKCGFLNNEQIKFWENLYTKGLGEFFYKNNIDFRNLIKISTDSIKFKQRDILDKVSSSIDSDIHNKKVLLPIGGGKDSIVSAEILKEKNIDFSWFMIETIENAIKVIDTSHVKSLYTISRNVETNFKLIKELSQQGFPDGHVPISAVYAFSAVIIAKLHDFDYIAISQERSSNIGQTTYLGMEINHQYSKTFEMESNIHEYILKYISPNIYHFSILRHLYEIQIASEFVKHPEYFYSFISCNKGLKTGIWCGICDKCVFTWSLLSAFLDIEILEKIWHKNLFEDKNLLTKFINLVGDGEMKAFDCVGTFEESKLALYLAKERLTKKNTDVSLPFILQNLDLEDGKNYLNYLHDYSNENLIPDKFLKKV